MQFTKYTLIDTEWGTFGLAATEKGLIKSALPAPEPGGTEKILLEGLSNPEFDSAYFENIESEIKAYFQGKTANFNRLTLDMPDKTPFAIAILGACRKINFAQTTTYAQLASLANHPKASRAAGSVLAKNPLPLIIPCHRVIRSDGATGRFSCPGGLPLKKRLIHLEKQSQIFHLSN